MLYLYECVFQITFYSYLTKVCWLFLFFCFCAWQAFKAFYTLLPSLSNCHDALPFSSLSYLSTSFTSLPNVYLTLTHGLTHGRFTVLPFCLEICFQCLVFCTVSPSPRFFFFHTLHLDFVCVYVLLACLSAGNWY